MILSKPKVSDASRIWDFLRRQGVDININSVLANLMDEKNMSLMNADKELNGVILAKTIGGMLEINAWGLKREDRSMFEKLYKKSRTLKIKRVGVMENERDTKRIEVLKAQGFKEIRKQEGIYPDSKAVILTRRV